MLFCDFLCVELTIQVAFGAGPPAVTAHIASAVRAVALLAVTACVPPPQPAVLPLLHLSADVWQQWGRGENQEENGQRQTSKAVVLLWLWNQEHWAGLYGTCPRDLHRPCFPPSTTQLHRDSGCPCKSARTTRADVSWLRCSAAGNDGHHNTASRQLPLPPDLSSIRTSAGTLCLSLSWDEPFFLWENVSSCLTSSMDLTITSSEPMRRDQRLRGRLEGSGVMWQTAPCLKRKSHHVNKKKPSPEPHVTIPVAFFLPKKSNLQWRRLNFYKTYSHAVCLRMNFTAAFYITFKTRWESVSTLVQHRGFNVMCECRVEKQPFGSFCRHLTEAAFTIKCPNTLKILHTRWMDCKTHVVSSEFRRTFVTVILNKP